MLYFLNVLQLVVYLALLFLLGHGLLWALSGAKSASNLFYQLFQIVNKPWFVMARWISPRQISNRHVPFVAFFVLLAVYIAVTLAKIEHCVSVGMQGCR
jgi:hypothetical protein